LLTRGVKVEVFRTLCHPVGRGDSKVGMEVYSCAEGKEAEGSDSPSLFRQGDFQGPHKLSARAVTNAQRVESRLRLPSSLLDFAGLAESIAQM
jgi:hypothetical protein